MLAGIVRWEEVGIRENSSIHSRYRLVSGYINPFSTIHTRIIGCQRVLSTIQHSMIVTAACIRSSSAEKAIAPVLMETYLS